MDFEHNRDIKLIDNIKLHAVNPENKNIQSQDQYINFSTNTVQRQSSKGVL